jgi:hypothetical protein
MSTPRGDRGSASPKTKALAFYLPQFHPIPENDAWWGPGFTEWLNVTRARPLYPGHYQPHVPGELGYYDLRVPEVRAAQAELARAHGVSGFVYYHYWFQGKQLLQRPFDEVLASGEPDFPFALCWANEEWTRNWDGRSGTVLMPQEYSDADDLAHIRWLAEAFADPRYITIDGRPLMLIYRPGLLPDPRRTTDRWRTEAQRLGLPDLYLGWVDGFGRPEDGPGPVGFDATVAFIPFGGRQRIVPAESTRTHRILDYPSAAASRRAEPAPPWKHFPSVMVGWDSTARHPGNATIFEGATPDAYRTWLERTVASVADVREEENYVFLLAWNEWAEGNHLEPDQRFGRAFLEATRAVLLPDAGPGAAAAGAGGSAPGPASTDAGRGPDAVERATTSAHALLRSVGADAPGGCVQLTVDTDGPGPSAPGDVVRLRALADPAAGPAGAGDERCDIEDGAALVATLDRHADVGSLLLVDVAGRLRRPHLLLSDLSSWSRAHGDVPLVLAVPNVTHRDHGVTLLAGTWDPSGPGRPGHDQLHQFTEASLTRLVERCGWAVAARDDVSAVQSDEHDTALADNLPEEMVGALTVLAETYNPQWAVEYFVWLLAPTGAPGCPNSFAAAVAPGPDDSRPAYTEEQRRAVDRYLASVGLVASETNRRAAAGRRTARPAWRRTLGRLLHSSPRTEAAYTKLRKGLS